MSDEPKGLGSTIAAAVILAVFAGLLAFAALRWALGYGFGG